MRVCAGARGNAAEALRVYEQLRTLLKEELGTTPGAAAKALHEQLLRGEANGVGAAAAMPPTRKPREMPRALAAPGGPPFVGRDGELDRLRDLWMQVGGGVLVAAFPAGEAAGLDSEDLVAPELDGAVVFEHIAKPDGFDDMDDAVGFENIEDPVEFEDIDDLGNDEHELLDSPPTDKVG